MTRPNRLAAAGQMCRTVTAALIAGVWRRRSISEVERSIKRLALREQAGIVGGVLGLMLLLSMFAAQFGILGLVVFWLLVIVLVN